MHRAPLPPHLATGSFSLRAADKAGLKAGDIITHADGTPIDPLSQREAVQLLRGAARVEVA